MCILYVEELEKDGHGVETGDGLALVQASRPRIVMTMYRDCGNLYLD